MPFLGRPPTAFVHLDLSAPRQRTPTLAPISLEKMRVGLFGAKGVGKTHLLHRAMGRPSEPVSEARAQVFGRSMQD